MLYKLLTILITLQVFFVHANPWGKDADIAQSIVHHKLTNQSCETPLFGPFAETMISFHQEIISPADGPRSHFYPSSSQYTLDAMRKYGFFKGFIMGCDRLMRENPEEWVYPKINLGYGNEMKHDPVK